MTALHDAVKRGDLEAIERLLKADRRLANARSETDARGTYPLHVAAQFGRAAAASQRNKHGLTPLGCAVGGTRGRRQKFSDATLEDWRKTAELIRSHGGVE